MHYQSVNEPATVKKLISTVNKTSGELLKKKPRYAIVLKMILLMTIFWNKSRPLI